MKKLRDSYTLKKTKYKVIVNQNSRFSPIKIKI